MNIIKILTFVSYLFEVVVVVVEEDDIQRLNVQVVHRLKHEVKLFYHLHHQLLVINSHHLVFFDDCY
jgi:hypothetical protein